MIGEPHGNISGGYHARMTVAEAAQRLDITEHAVRARLSRGTLTSEKDEDGRVYVYVPQDTGRIYAGSDDGTPGYPELVAALREQIEDQRAQLAAEREANRENRRIIAGLTSRLPELEASEGREEGAHGDTSEEKRTTPSSAQTAPESAAQRPWWRRIFGG